MPPAGRYSPWRSAPTLSRMRVSIILAAILSAVLSMAIFTPKQPVKPDVLVILLDDVSKPDIAEALTPTLDTLAADWLTFERFYTCPTCSPTRATMLTGLIPAHHGIGRPVGYQSGEPGLDTELGTLAGTALSAGYQTAAFGKWHMAPGLDHDLEARMHPHAAGFLHFDGALSNAGPQAGNVSHYDYKRVTDLAITLETAYTSLAWTDAAIAWWETTTDPKFAWLAYHAPHAPFSVPPGYDEGGTKRSRYLDALAHLDNELRRLLQAVDLDKTLVLILGDNGTPQQVTPPELEGTTKGSLWENGINVPALALGWGVKPGTASPLIGSQDLHVTLGAVMGKAVESTDGVTFLPSILGQLSPHPRTTLLVQKFAPNGFGPRTEFDYRAAIMASPPYKVRSDDAGVEYSLLPDEGTPIPRESLPPAAAIALDATLASGD